MTLQAIIVAVLVALIVGLLVASVVGACRCAVRVSHHRAAVNRRLFGAIYCVRQ